MLIFELIFTVFGLIMLAVALCMLPMRDDAVRFPKWLRVSYVAMTGAFGLSSARIFSECGAASGICSGAVTALSLWTAVRLGMFKIEIGSDKFVCRTLLRKVSYGYDEITDVSEEAGVLIITVRGRRIFLLIPMHGCLEFTAKLQENGVFERCLCV